MKLNEKQIKDLHDYFYKLVAESEKNGEINELKVAEYDGAMRVVTLLGVDDNTILKILENV